MAKGTIRYQGRARRDDGSYVDLDAADYEILAWVGPSSTDSLRNYVVVKAGPDVVRITDVDYADFVERDTNPTVVRAYREDTGQYSVRWPDGSVNLYPNGGEVLAATRLRDTERGLGVTTIDWR